MSAEPNAVNRQARLDEILLRHDDLVAAGATTPQLEDYVKLYPDLAAELRSYFEDREQLRQRTVPLCALAGMGDGEPLPIRSFGKYEVLRREGAGGMGIVVRAFDIEVKREVVLKVMKEDGLANPELVRRFRLEGQLLGQLVHPAIVPLHEMGETPDNRKLLYLAMKLVRGHTLDWLLKRRASLGEQREWFLDVLVAVCHAVHFAHSKRVLHRDLKPGNVMVGEHQEIQLTDFGLAKVMPAKAGATTGAPILSVTSRGEQTAIGAAPGSPAYMAPEQARGKGDALEERCDVFGLGGILCEILTGKPPRTLADIGMLLRDCTDPKGASLAGAYDRLDRCGGPAALVALCRQCLSFDPAQRPVSARAVADAILAYRAGLARAAEDEKLKAAQATVRAEAAVKRQKLAYGLLAAVVLLMGSVSLLGGVGLLWWGAYEQRKNETTASVNRRIQTAQELRADAQTAPVEDIERLLSKASEQASEADREAQRGPASEAVRQKARDALADVNAEVAAARKDRAMLARLLELTVFSASGDGDNPATVIQGGLFDADRRYAAVFRNWGLDPDHVAVAEAAARIRSRPVAIATEVIAALDQWAYLRRMHYLSSALRLFDLANAADQPDPLRQELRDLLASSEPPGAGGAELDRERVRSLVKKVNPRTEPTLTLLVLTRVLWEVGDGEKCEPLLREAVRARPGDALLRAHLGQLYCFMGAADLGQHVKAAQGLPAIGPMRPAELPKPGDAASFQSPYFQDAVACGEVLVSQRPEARSMLASALLYTPRSKEGLQMFRELQQENKNDPDLQLLVDSIEIKNLFLNGKLAEAAAALEKVSQTRKNDDAAQVFRLLAAVIHLKNEELDKTATLCREVCRTSQSPLILAYAYQLLGVVLTFQGQVDEAVKAYGEASRYSQGIPSGHVYTAQICEELKDLDKANQALEAGLKQDPTNAALLLYVVEFRRRQGREQEAREIQKRLAQAELPTDARSLFKLGCGLMRIQEYKLAVKALQQHLKLDPDHKAAKTMLHKAEELQRSQKP